ncbi:MAG: hypothetical protein ABIJ97_16150 [Bacteroidota bacterium]
MGDSHIMNGIDPRQIKNSFNYGSGEESYIQTYYKIKNIVEIQNFMPEYIILSIDPSSFSSFRATKINNEEYWTKYLDYYEIAAILENNSIVYGKITGKYFSYTGECYVFMKYIFSRRKERAEIFKGYKPKFEDLSLQKNIDKTCKDRAYLYLNHRNQFDEGLKIYFNKILKFCETNKIKIILIKMPLSESYIKYVETLIDIEDNYNEIINLTSDVTCVYKIIDYQNIFFRDNSKFQNPDHLNDKGALELSKLINQELYSE